LLPAQRFIKAFYADQHKNLLIASKSIINLPAARLRSAGVALAKVSKQQA